MLLFLQALPLLFPLLFCVLVYAAFLATEENSLQAFRYSVMASLLAAILLTEFLSLFSAISYHTVLYGWALLSLAVWLRWRPKNLTLRRASWIKESAKKGSASFVTLSLLLIIPVFFLAIYCPPNNWDALAYHLPRVAQWWSRGSVAHYPSHNLYQLSHPALSEYLLLHLYGLSGADRFLNLPQFFAWIGIPLLLSYWKKERSFDWRMAALLALTLPTGILQASTSKNDLLLSFLAVNLLVAADRFGRNQNWKGGIELGLSLALLLFTKGTAYMIAVPVLGICLYRSVSRKNIKFLAATVLIAAAINLPYYARNIKGFGTPFPSGGEQFLISRVSIAGIASNFVKNVSLQLSLPSLGWAEFMRVAVEKASSALGVGVQDPDFTNEKSGFSLQPLYFYEDYDGNTLVFLLLLGITAWAIAKRRMRTELLIFWMGILLLSLLRWKSWNARLHLPFFYLAIPAVVAVLSLWPKRMKAAVVAVFVLCALPYLVWNPLKPVLARGNGLPTVFEIPREMLYFSGRTEVFSYYRDLLARLQGGSCRALAIQSNNDSFEFPIWAMLGAPSEPLFIRHDKVANESRSFPESTPAPCATFSVP